MSIVVSDVLTRTKDTSYTPFVAQKPMAVQPTYVKLKVELSASYESDGYEADNE